MAHVIVQTLFPKHLTHLETLTLLEAMGPILSVPQCLRLWGSSDGSVKEQVFHVALFSSCVLWANTTL